MKKIIVDLQLKDTEMGWIKRVDRLVIAFAPGKGCRGRDEGHFPC